VVGNCTVFGELLGVARSAFGQEQPPGCVRDRRAEAIRQALAHWRQFRPGAYDASKGIQLGALVCLVDSDDKQQHLFLGPDGGGMRFR
jgi:hypothetical protein